MKFLRNIAAFLLVLTIVASEELAKKPSECGGAECEKFCDNVGFGEGYWIQGHWSALCTCCKFFVP